MIDLGSLAMTCTCKLILPKRTRKFCLPYTHQLCHLITYLGADSGNYDLVVSRKHQQPSFKPSKSIAQPLRPSSPGACWPGYLIIGQGNGMGVFRRGEMHSACQLERTRFFRYHRQSPRGNSDTTDYQYIFCLDSDSSSTRTIKNHRQSDINQHKSPPCPR